MKNKFAAALALDLINKQMKAELDLLALDAPNRSHAHGFAIGGEHGKQFILVLGRDRELQQTRIITEKTLNLPNIPGVVHDPSPVKGNRVSSQKVTGLGYANRLSLENQCSFLVENSSALESLLKWYATVDRRGLSSTQQPEPELSVEHLDSMDKDLASSETEQCADILGVINGGSDATTKEQLIKARLGQGKCN